MARRGIHELESDGMGCTCTIVMIDGINDQELVPCIILHRTLHGTFDVI